MLTRRKLGGLLAGLGALAVTGPARGESLNDRLTGDLTPVHDPCIIEANGTFHVFSTSQADEDHNGTKGLIHWRTSEDLVTWTFKGAVLADFPQWVKDAVPGIKGIWAPEIAFDGSRFLLYYAGSTFGSNRSVIGLLSTPTLDTADPAFGWKDEGLVFQSDKWDKFNAIDPGHVIDADGRQWLAFGSFWSGLKLIELDPATGKPKAGAKPTAIAGRDRPGAIEAPFIFKRGDWYYLLASYDFCCRGADSTYYTCVGRSKSVEGPYIDHDGRHMEDNGGTILLHAKLDPSGRFKGPGGASVLTSGEHQIIVYHAYDADNKGAPTLRMQALAWTPDGWPVAV